MNDKKLLEVSQWEMDEFPEQYREAAKRWDLKTLLLELNEMRRMETNGEKEGLAAIEKQFLCLLLSNSHNPKTSYNDIVRKIKLTGQDNNDLKKKANNLKQKIFQYGLYVTISAVVGSDIKDWKDIIILLFEKGYNIKRVRAKFSFSVEAHNIDLSKLKLENFQNMIHSSEDIDPPKILLGLQKILNDLEINIEEAKWED